MTETCKFTQYLTVLVDYSKHIDEGTVTDAEYSEYRRLEIDILNAVKAGSILWTEYQALIYVYNALQYDFRSVIRQNRSKELKVYTMETWKNDRTFRAIPGQEIDQEVYTAMYNAGATKGLSFDILASAFTEYALRIGPGFIVNTPYSKDADGRILFPAFGAVDQAGSLRYYYLGLTIAEC